MGIFVLLLSTFLTLTINANAITPKTKQPTKKPTLVFAEKIAAKPLFDRLTYPARVESSVNALVLAETDGIITKILHPLGARVRRGEAVAILRHTDPVYQYAPLIVRSPVAGVINQIFLTEGGLVNKGDRLVSITQPNKLKIMIEVAAQDIKSIHAGLKGQLHISGDVKPIDVTVKGLSPSIDPMLGTATCELIAGADAQKRLAPGLVGQVEFKVNQRNGILVPEDALVYEGDSPFVRVLESDPASKDTTSKRVSVQLGHKDDGKVEILGGLKPGEQIIDRSAGFVADGQPVKVSTSSASE